MDYLLKRKKAKNLKILFHLYKLNHTNNEIIIDDHTTLIYNYNVIILIYFIKLFLLLFIHFFFIFFFTLFFLITWIWITLKCSIIFRMSKTIFLLCTFWLNCTYRFTRLSFLIYSTTYYILSLLLSFYFLPFLLLLPFFFW